MKVYFVQNGRAELRYFIVKLTNDILFVIYFLTFFILHVTFERH